MQVNPDRQSWKCWVCDLGGDVFSFLMQKEGVTFPEALRMLADRAGITLEERKGKGSRDSGEDKRGLYHAMQWAVAEYHRSFAESPEAAAARDYIRERGIESGMIEKFQLGFAPESWSWLLDRGASAGQSMEHLESVGLAARSERGTRFDRFRGRVIFPINDPQGRPIAVGGRILPGATNEGAKYINCNETRLYHKNQTLYALDHARDTMSKTRQAIVMEGYTDVIMAFQHGITNTVACCGTALGENHIKLLKRYCEILELFVAAQMDLRILTLPDGLDPCDYLLRFGGENLKGLIAGAIDALEHKIRTVCKGFDPLLDTHRANVALEDILSSLARVSQQGLLENDGARLRQDQILVRLGRQFGIEQTEIRLRLDAIRQRAKQIEQFRKQAKKGTASTQSASGASGSNSVPQQVRRDAPAGDRVPSSTVSDVASVEYRYSELLPIECELLEILVLHPELVSFAIERFPVDKLQSSTAKYVFQLYLDLELDGHPLDFPSVMSATEEPRLKSLLVSLEDQAARKAAKSTMTAEERLHSLCEHLGNQEDVAHHRSRLRTLEKKDLDPQSELELLQSVLQDAKIRHGIIRMEE
jgi:DNA primase